MAEYPTSSSTMYTTFGAPSGALDGSNGVQSGSESRISTLIVPLKGSLTAHLFRSAAQAVPLDTTGTGLLSAGCRASLARGERYGRAPTAVSLCSMQASN